MSASSTLASPVANFLNVTIEAFSGGIMEMDPVHQCKNHRNSSEQCSSWSCTTQTSLLIAPPRIYIKSNVQLQHLSRSNFHEQIVKCLKKLNTFNAMMQLNHHHQAPLTNNQQRDIQSASGEKYTESIHVAPYQWYTLLMQKVHYTFDIKQYSSSACNEA